MLVSEFNAAGNPVYDFVFRRDNGSTMTMTSPDPGRALITGIEGDPDVSGDPHGEESINAFKIPSLWGVFATAPYFHDNSAKTLEDVVRPMLDSLRWSPTRSSAVIHRWTSRIRISRTSWRF